MRGTEDKIMDAAMELVVEKGYSDMTTLDIAKRAGVNEATLFRRFGSKKEIVLAALAQERWVPTLPDGFSDGLGWELQADIEYFLRQYCSQVTPQFVRLSIGLRSPQIFAETKSHIMKVPSSYMGVLVPYFTAMQKKGKCREGDPQSFALTLFSSALGFVFLQASFGKELSALEQDTFIRTTAQTLSQGLRPLP